jgi:hypothetical protein
MFFLLPILFSFFFQGFAQTRMPRTISIRRYQPVMRAPIFVPIRMPIRPPRPSPSLYFSRGASLIPVANMQNAFIYQNNSVREYPSSSSRNQARPAEYNSHREIPSYDRNAGSYETRIQNIESRLRNLESLASQIRARQDSVPSQNTISDGYNQRLVRLEEQMQALRDVLVELRNYLASKR